MNYVFDIRTDYDERSEIWLNDTHLISLNHDEHGWEGIETAISLIEIIAPVFGATIIRTDIIDE